MEERGGGGEVEKKEEDGEKERVCFYSPLALCEKWRRSVLDRDVVI